MKRITAIFLLAVLGFGMFGCQQKDNLVAPVSYYYLRTPLANGEVIHGTEDSVIIADIRESAGRETDYSYLLKIYLTGPQDERFQSPFPRSTFLVDFQLDGVTAKLVLTDNFAKMTGIDLSLACACLTMTVLEMTGAERVILRTESVLIDGQESIIFHRSDFLLFDNAKPQED